MKMTDNEIEKANTSGLTLQFLCRDAREAAFIYASINQIYRLQTEDMGELVIWDSKGLDKLTASQESSHASRVKKCM